tara:strand:+ start:55352 stop:55975 length:624 start_codon:yes stop_codon:yes gene_type:complete
MSQVIEYWDNIEIDTIVILKDSQTVEYMMEQGYENLRDGVDCSVQRIRTIHDITDSNIRWYLFDLEVADFVWYLVVKVVGDDNDIYLYFETDDFAGGDRKDALDNDCHFLFEEPEDNENPDLAKLEFAKDINQGEIIYSTDGTTFGRTNEEGSEDMFTSITEYHCAAEEDNPYLITLEFQTEENAGTEFGYIMFLQGCVILHNDIEI